MPPSGFDIKINASASDIADALTSTIDGIAQRDERRRQAELANIATEQQLERAMAQAIHETHMQGLTEERERLAVQKSELEIERERSALTNDRRISEKQGLLDLLEVTDRMVESLYPGVDDPIKRAELKRDLLPKLLQHQQADAPLLALPEPPPN